MATTLERKRNKAYAPRKYNQKPEAGDIVELAAISTRDTRHADRHFMLWLEYTVVSVAPASPEEGGYDYKGWYSLILTPTVGTAKVPYGTDILILTCQVRIISREANAEVKIAYTKQSRRAPMLEDINAILASPEIIAGGKIPIANNDKSAWRTLSKKTNYFIEWRNLANDRPKWKRATTLFPFVTNQPTIEFRVRPGTIDYMEFRKKYKIIGKI